MKHLHVASRKIAIAEIFRFQKRDQKEGELIKEYLTLLPRLTEHCALEDALRNHQVCWMKDEVVQKMITFDKR